MLELLTKLGNEITSGIRANLVKYNRNASGTASQSLRFDIVVTPTKSKLTVWGESYIYQLEYGRGPTRNRQGNIFTVDTIEKWIVVKGIQPTGITLKSLAFLIWRKINEKGYNGTVGVITDTVNPQNLANWKKDIGSVVTKTIIKEIQNAVNS